jgi:hypothetical protein
MLFTEGQKRITRESRDRLTELFVAARDAALDVEVTTGRSKPVGTWRQPSYVRASQPQAVRSPAVRDATLLALSLAYPGMVKRTDS